MRLKTKLTIAFAAVALLPIAVLAGVARVVIANQYRGELRHAVEQAQADVEHEYERLGDEVAAATARMARSDDPALGSLLVELARSAAEASKTDGAGADAGKAEGLAGTDAGKAEGLANERRRELEARIESEARALGFDVLTLLDERGEVLAAPHFPGRVGDEAPELLRLGEARAPQLVDEQVLEGGRAQRRLALVSARTVEARFAAAALDGEGVKPGRRPRVLLIAGRLIGPAFLARAYHGAGGARLLAPDGALVAGPPPPPHSRLWPRASVELTRPDGTLAGRIEVAVPAAELERTLALISMAAVGLGAFGLFLALLLGALVARRVSGPLGELAEGAHQVARGRLDVAVPARGRDEVAELARAFNGMTADLRTAREELVRAERVAAWREIAQRIAHEIKNPLTPIQMAIETLQRAQERRAPSFDELFTESAATILDEVARLKHIVAEFSSFARLPAPRLAPCDLSAVLEATLALYAGAVPVQRALAPSLPLVRADRDQVTQVLVNLLENARDALAQSPGGAIRVATRAAATHVEIEIADDGPGISDEARARLFTPYFTTKPKGTGLGLAIVHRIVTDHGGEIRVGGAPGQGAVFTVALPLAPASSEPASP